MTTSHLDNLSPGYLLFATGMSLFSIVVLAAMVLVETENTEVQSILSVADNILCIFFLTDFLVTLIKTDNKRKYLTGWGIIDLLSSIPSVEILRVGRLGRIIRLARIFRMIKSTSVITSFLLQKRKESAFLAILLISVILILSSSVSILYVEQGIDGANIKTAEDAMWWAITTITTVGYGDRYPVSTEGRLLASMLMVAGIGIFGTFTGLVSSWFMQTTVKESAHE